MKQGYKDILEGMGRPPEWWDENGTPRFSPFHPSRLSDIYAKESVLAVVACQGCGEEFNVAISRSGFSPDELVTMAYGGKARTLKHQIEHTALHYGDPPNTGCCGSGPSMSSELVRIVEFWERNKHTEYQWAPVLFGPVPKTGQSETPAF